jgi:hypothetical protein
MSKPVYFVLVLLDAESPLRDLIKSRSQVLEMLVRISKDYSVRTHSPWQRLQRARGSLELPGGATLGASYRCSCDAGYRVSVEVSKYLAD